MYESTFVDDGNLQFTKPRILNDGRLKACLDPQTVPDTCLMPLGDRGDSLQADAVAERGPMSKVRTTTDHGDSTTPFC